MFNRLFSCGKSCGHVIKQISFLWYEPCSSASFLPQAILSSSKDSNSHKDDGVFKAPPPPPKVIKSETIPTRLNQDIVTALKCRKEHKEVSLEHTELGFFCVLGEEAEVIPYLYSLFTTFVCLLHKKSEMISHHISRQTAVTHLIHYTVKGSYSMHVELTSVYLKPSVVCQQQ